MTIYKIIFNVSYCFNNLGVFCRNNEDIKIFTIGKRHKVNTTNLIKAKKQQIEVGQFNFINGNEKIYDSYNGKITLYILANSVGEALKKSKKFIQNQIYKYLDNNNKFKFIFFDEKEFKRYLYRNYKYLKECDKTF